MRLFFWKLIIQTKLVLFWNSNWNKEIEQSVDLCYSDDKIIIKINIFSFLLPNLGADFFRKFLHIKILLLLRAAESEQKIASMIGILRLSLVLSWILLAASVGSRAKGYKNKTYDCKKDHKISHFYGFDYPAFEFDIAAIIVFFNNSEIFQQKFVD